MHADAQRVARRVGRLEGAPGPAALDGLPGDVLQVQDEPAVVGRDATGRGLLDLRFVHEMARYPRALLRTRRPRPRPAPARPVQGARRAAADRLDLDAGGDGRVNLAPYSFFNAVCDRPPMVAFSSSGLKYSAAFAVASDESVADSPCALECKVVHALELHDVDGRVDTAALQAIARCGYLDEYAAVTELFTMTRPDA